MQNFEVIAAGIPPTRLEYREAMRLSTSDLPELSAADKTLVERTGVNPESQQRYAEAKRRAKTREYAEGQALGVVVQGMIDTIEPSLRISVVQRVGRPDGWFFRVSGNDRKKHFTLELETTDRLLAGEATLEETDILSQNLASLLSTDVLRSGVR